MEYSERVNLTRHVKKWFKEENKPINHIRIRENIAGTIEVLHILGYLQPPNKVDSVCACPNCGGEITGVGHKCLQCEQ